MKLEEQHILELRCEFEELITEREGMMVENRMRERQGQAMAYDEENFNRLRGKIKTLREKIIRFGEQKNVL